MITIPTEMAIFPGQPLARFDTVSVALTPEGAAVYTLCRADGTYIYFGETRDLRRRLMEHLVDTPSCLHREGAVFFAYERHSSPGARLARLNQLIAAYPTVCN